ncbi:hypothetical protein Tco_0680437 [Tanacetum coccineum]|uniref:Uncharacterized protein n=1 Tax=Tanacetum coccineum TaxID=301880 RepID=A0ABQ4XLP3_9ASTR
MVSNQAIEYAPQCGDLTVESLVFQTNNVIGNFNYPQNVPTYKPICKFLMNFPLKKAFTKCPSVLYQNLLREFWCMTIAYDPNPPADETQSCLLKEYLIKFLVMNSKKPLTLDFKTFTTSTSLDYNNEVLLDTQYTQDEKFKSLHGILGNSNFLKDPSKVTEIELTAHMIAVNIQKDSVSPLPFSEKKKKVKSLTVTPTLPKSQGPEALGALSKKRQKPKSKKTPTKTQVTPLTRPTEGFEQSHSVSSGNVPDPQNPERNIQLAVGNKQPIDTRLPSTVSDEGTGKTTPLPKGPRGDKDSEV